MSDIIRLLPDSVANQIAAGEVIQRPASVVKEMMENAVDAGAETIAVNLKDAGKTLIQVIDDGCGMSETDARMAFERHSTSKISKAEDLFLIRTLGFRGEALASVAAVAEVLLKTKRVEDEIGTQLDIRASEVIRQEPVACPDGSNFLVKNLFFNVPARRKFLKTHSTELKHIINEFNRVSLARPNLKFSLVHNNTGIYNLPKSNIKQRIINIFGRGINQNLIPVHVETSIITVHGFIGKPESARKTFGEQYFFVNQRYMRHPYFHKAVIQAYDPVISSDSIPSYFLYIETNPSFIDVNIHPTKTEIKFEDERSAFQILLASVKEALGKSNLVPTLDFDKEGVIDIPILDKKTEPKLPGIDINTGYNPFEVQQDNAPGIPADKQKDKKQLANWEILYEGLKDVDKFSDNRDKLELKREDDPNINKFIQLKTRYILTPVRSGLMIIDQKRAHERILYDIFVGIISDNRNISQKDMYPQTLELNAADHTLLMEIFDDICRLGFDIRDLGNNSIVINGYPEEIGKQDPKAIIEGFLEDYKQTRSDIKTKAREKIAQSMAKASAIPYNRSLSNYEMRKLVDQLFACKNPAYSPEGKPVFAIMPSEELEKKVR